MQINSKFHTPLAAGGVLCSVQSLTVLLMGRNSSNIIVYQLRKEAVKVLGAQLLLWSSEDPEQKSLVGSKKIVTDLKWDCPNDKGHWDMAGNPGECKKDRGFGEIQGKCHGAMESHLREVGKIPLWPGLDSKHMDNGCKQCCTFPVGPSL